MKLIKNIMPVIFILALLLSSGFGAGAASETDIKNSRDKAFDYYKTGLKEAFLGENPAETPDVWHLACLYGASKMNDTELGFLIPAIDDGLDVQALTTTDLCKLILIHALNKDLSYQVNGVNLLEELAGRQQLDGTFAAGDFEATSGDMIFSIIALEVTGADYDSEAAASALIAMRTADNGFNDFGTEGNVDQTGMALMALSLIEGNKEAADAKIQAVEFLKSTLNENAFFVGKGEWDSANTCSQSYAVIGLVSAGEDLFSDVYTVNGLNVTDALLVNQDPDNGGFWYDISYKENPNDWFPAPDNISTYQAILALNDLIEGQNIWRNLKNELNQEIVTPEPTTQAATQADVTETSTPVNRAEDKNPDTGMNTQMVWLFIFTPFIIFLVCCRKSIKHF